MPNLNKIMLIGHLGKDPQVRYTQQGDLVVSFSMAVKTGYGDKAKTEWFLITAWKKLGEVAKKYLSKGKAVYVEGSVGLKEWKNRDGVVKQNLQVRANEIVLIGDKSQMPEDRPAGEWLDPDMEGL